MMTERVHGMDRHKRFTTISVLNREGKEVHFEGACWDLKKYVQGLGSTDAVVLEACTGAFWWADQIEARGGEVLRGRPAQVPDHQGLVEQDGS
jgi:transposase